MEQEPRKVYEVGYADRICAALVERLMQEDESLLIIDTRKTPWCKDNPEWRKAELSEKYGQRYHWAGEYLGNINHKNRHLPIVLAWPRQGIHGLITYLNEGHNLILLCGCYTYAGCHRKVIIEALEVELQRRGLPAVQMMYSWLYKPMIA